VIVPNSRFGCDGRVTGIRASMRYCGPDGDFPTIQIWHPLSLDSTVYNRSGQVQVSCTGGRHIYSSGSSYYSISLSLNSNEQIEFQSDDVLGYYQPVNSRCQIWSIDTSEYVSYSSVTNANSPGNMIDTSNTSNLETQGQPLIEVMFGKKHMKMLNNQRGYSL